MIAAPAVSPAVPSNGQPREQPAPTEQNLHLTGRPAIKDFLRYVQQRAVDPGDEGDRIDQWHAAAEIVRQVEVEEAGFADNPPIQKLGPEYEPLLIELLQDPIIQCHFNTVPTQVALVELDRLVVYQKYIDLTHAARIEKRVGPAPGRETVFRTCLASNHMHPPATWARTSHDTFTFLSPSRDLRYLETMRLEPGNLQDYPPPGTLVGVAGLAVGFGSNFLNAIYANGRLILNNGSHRAYALRRLGVTHAPCLIQHVVSRDALSVVASREIRHNKAYFFENPRPAVLKDYFDSRIYTVMDVRPRLRQITIKFEVTETYIPAI